MMYDLIWCPSVLDCHETSPVEACNRRQQKKCSFSCSVKAATCNGKVATYTIAAKLLEKYLSNKTVSVPMAMCLGVVWLKPELQRTCVCDVYTSNKICMDARASNDIRTDPCTLTYRCPRLIDIRTKYTIINYFYLTPLKVSRSFTN